MTVWVQNAYIKVTSPNPLFNLAAGDDVIVTRNGIIVGGTSDLIALSSNNSVQVDGQVYSANGFAAILQTAFDGAVDIRIGVTGVVASPDSNAITLFGDGSLLTNEGTLQGNAALSASSADQLTVVNSGRITAEATALAMGQDAYVHNTGEIVSETMAMELSGGTIENYGRVSGPTTAIHAISGAAVLNHGDIVGGASALNIEGAAYVLNTGAIEGVNALFLSDFGDVVLNSGLIIGNVYLAGGDNRYDGRQGWLDGSLIADDGNDTILGGAEDDYVFAGDGANRVDGGGGADTMFGAGEGFRDTLLGGEGDDSLNGNGGFDLIKGGEGDDFIALENATAMGGEGDDRLLGGDGFDWMRGGAGDDTLNGGRKADDLRGGDGADVFQYWQARDSQPGKLDMDVIEDFHRAQGDRIDLYSVDAQEGVSGNQAFAFLGTAAFSGAKGQLRYDVVGADTLIQGDTDGDGTADFAVLVRGVTVLYAVDFVL